MNNFGFPSSTKPYLPYGKPGARQVNPKNSEIPLLGTVKEIIQGPEEEYDAGDSGAQITLDFTNHYAQVLAIDTPGAEVNFIGLVDGKPYTLIVHYKGQYTPNFVDVGSWKDITVPTWSGSSLTTYQYVDIITLYASKGNIYGAASTGHPALINGKVYGFGVGTDIIGDNTVISKTSPVPVMIPGVATQVIQHAALLETGRVYCWGPHPGDVTAVSKSTPVQVSLPAGTYTKVLGVVETFFAQKNTGEYYFWGLRTPDGTNFNAIVTSPVAVVLPFSITQMAGRIRLIAKGTDNSVWTWGPNTNKLVADNVTATYSTPYNYVPANSTIRQVAAGYDTFYYLKTDGTVHGWGWNAFGQLGDNTTGDKTTPTQASTAVSFVSIAAGRHHVIALTATGELYNWGYINAVTVSTPVKITTSVSFTAIDVVGDGSFALDKDGRLYVWGDSAYGNGTWVPEKVSGNFKLKSLSPSGAVAGVAGSHRAYNFML